MRPAVVLGNGPSRLLLDPLKEIPWPTFGCNGIINSFVPTYYLCADRWGLAEFGGGPIPHRQPPADHLCYNFNSCGGAALYSALSMGFAPVYLIGFDGNAAGHACPDFGQRRNPKFAPPKKLDRLWRAGFQMARESFPGREVLLMGYQPSLLNGMFPRAPLRPWEDEGG